MELLADVRMKNASQAEVLEDTETICVVVKVFRRGRQRLGLDWLVSFGAI